MQIPRRDLTCDENGECDEGPHVYVATVTDDG